jgi:hypothetical protein
MSIQSFINSPFNKPAPIPAPVVYSLENLWKPSVAKQVPVAPDDEIFDFEIVKNDTDTATLTLVVPAGTYNLQMLACFSPANNDQLLSYGQLLLYDTVSNTVLAESQGYSGVSQADNVGVFWIFNHEQLIKFTTSKTISLLFQYSESKGPLDIRTGTVPTPRAGITGVVSYNPRAVLTKVPDEPTVIIPTF